MHVGLSFVLAVLEQCMTFSMSGVSLQVSFRQVALCVRLVSVALQRHLHLKHDYIVMSRRARLSPH